MSHFVCAEGFRLLFSSRKSVWEAAFKKKYGEALSVVSEQLTNNLHR
jgi:hypothetical protein